VDADLLLHAKPDRLGADLSEPVEHQLTHFHHGDTLALVATLDRQRVAPSTDARTRGHDVERAAIVIRREEADGLPIAIPRQTLFLGEARRGE
jgi:hypothetical protein